MKKLSIQVNLLAWAFLAIGAITLVACSAEPPENSKIAQARRGKVFFDEHCVTCHGESAKGDGPESQNLDIKVADLTTIQKRRGLKEFPIVEIASIIDGRNQLKAHGPREMPTWGKYFADEEHLTNDEIRGKMGELIAYLMQIQTSD
ncbi:MAG: cytochrome c [Saprospiraceae bacterium]